MSAEQKESKNLPLRLWLDKYGQVPDFLTRLVRETQAEVVGQVFKDEQEARQQCEQACEKLETLTKQRREGKMDHQEFLLQVQGPKNVVDMAIEFLGDERRIGLEFQAAGDELVRDAKQAVGKKCLYRLKQNTYVLATIRSLSKTSRDDEPVEYFVEFTADKLGSIGGCSMGKFYPARRGLTGLFLPLLSVSEADLRGGIQEYDDEQMARVAKTINRMSKLLACVYGASDPRTKITFE